MKLASIKTLLIVWHSRTGTAQALARAVHDGALASGEAVDIRLIPAAEVEPAMLLTADGYVFCGPENLASMSGAMKEMVDRCYYAALDRIQGRPYALIVAAGTDGTNVVRQWQRIATGWRLKAIAEPIIALTGADTPEAIAAPKTPAPGDVEQARALGGAMATGLAMGIF
jgi:NAD(P)H-dependent FMN reductase